jgi:hypothetical protein
MTLSESEHPLPHRPPPTFPEGSGRARRDRIEDCLAKLTGPGSALALAQEFAQEVLNNVLDGVQGPYLDLSPEDVRLLQQALGAAMLDAATAQRVSALERSTEAFPSPTNGVPLVYQRAARMQWLDTCSRGESDMLAFDPPHVIDIIRQTVPTAPASADFELFSAARVAEFTRRVEASCSVKNFRVGIARADLVFANGVVWQDHPIHTLSQFELHGQTHVGSFFGSSSGLLLRYFKHVPSDYLHAMVTFLVHPTIEMLAPCSTTIGIPAPVRFNAATQSWQPENRPVSPHSLTYRILTSAPLGFALMKAPSFSSDGPIALHNEYFHRGPPGLWDDPEYRQAITSIREVRRTMRVEARGDGGFLPIELKRDRIRKAWAREFVAQYFGVRGQGRAINSF